MPTESATDEEFLQWKKDRNEALLSLNETQLRAYFHKYNGNYGHPNPGIFMAGIHKVITGCLDLPLEFRKKSKAYLTARGLQSMDGGELSTEIQGG